MIPKVGNIVRLTSEFVTWHKRKCNESYFGGSNIHWPAEYKDKNLVIYKIDDDMWNYFYFHIENDEAAQCRVVIGHTTGGFSCDADKYPIVFELASSNNSVNSDYCICGGPEKEYIGFNSRIIICVTCGKDKR